MSERVMRRMINSVETEWTPEIQRQWDERVQPKFREGTWCSDANYFTPRPYVNEYSQPTDMAGFVYTVQPGNRVAYVEWIGVGS